MKLCCILNISNKSSYVKQQFKAWPKIYFKYCNFYLTDDEQNQSINQSINQIKSIKSIKSINQSINQCSDPHRDSIVVSIGDGVTSIFGGFVIFSFLGHMAHEMNVQVQDVVTNGKSRDMDSIAELVKLICTHEI